MYIRGRAGVAVLHLGCVVSYSAALLALWAKYHFFPALFIHKLQFCCIFWHLDVDAEDPRVQSDVSHAFFNPPALCVRTRKSLNSNFLWKGYFDIECDTTKASADVAALYRV